VNRSCGQLDFIHLAASGWERMNKIFSARREKICDGCLKTIHSGEQAVWSDGMEEILCADCDKYVTEHNVIVWNPGEIGKLRSEEGECL